MNRIQWLRQAGPLLLAGALSAWATLAPAQTPTAWPTKPIKIIVGYSPGGANDILARLVGQKLAEAWGQTVQVENRPSTAAIIGTDAVAKATPDGYTLLMGASGPIVFNPALYARLPYSATHDLAPVVMIGSFPLVLVVQGSSPLRSVKDLAAHTRARPTTAPARRPSSWPPSCSRPAPASAASTSPTRAVPIRSTRWWPARC